MNSRGCANSTSISMCIEPCYYYTNRTTHYGAFFP